MSSCGRIFFGIGIAVIFACVTESFVPMLSGRRSPLLPGSAGRGRRSIRLGMVIKDDTARDPQLIVTFLMKSLALNNFPEIDSGLESVWELSGDTTKGIFDHNLTEFIELAHETAEEFPTSFYGAAMFGKNWTLERPMVMVGGNTSDCWIATQLMKTISSDGRMRRWQWELRKHRRPPNLGCWYVESIGSSDKDGNFIPEE